MLSAKLRIQERAAAYKVKVNVKAAGSKNYKKFSKAVTFTVKVK